jgi:hypothetical protein
MNFKLYEPVRAHHSFATVNVFFDRRGMTLRKGAPFVCQISHISRKIFKQTANDAVIT